MMSEKIVRVEILRAAAPEVSPLLIGRT